MKRTHIAALLAALAAVPAAGSILLSHAKSGPCFTAGPMQYQITPSTRADYRVRITDTASSSDVRLQLVDNPADADFVLIGDGSGQDNACAPGAVITIRADAAEPKPDMTVSLSRDAADHKIYVDSAAFSQQDAAALVAVLWHDPRKRAISRPMQALAQRR